MNRHGRRAAARKAGKAWWRAQEERLFLEGAARAEQNIALHMSPADAREMLAKWAAIPGRSQVEVDALNRSAGASTAQTSAEETCRKP